jgi:alpha-galactosidase
MRKLPAWMTTPQTVSGEWLQQAGLALPSSIRKAPF